MQRFPGGKAILVMLEAWLQAEHQKLQIRFCVCLALEEMGAEGRSCLQQNVQLIRGRDDYR